MRDLELVHHFVTGQGRVIGLDVELEVGEQIVVPQEVQAGGCVGIILVFGWLLGFGLDIEGAAESDLFLVRDGHVQEPAEVVELALHVGVEQGRIAFTAAPERIAGPPELERDFHGLLDLGGSEGKNVEVGARRSPVQIAWVGEEIGGSPEQLDTRASLFILENLDDFVQIGVAFLEVLAFGGDVAIVEGVEGYA